MLSSDSVDQVDAQPLGILKALGVDGRDKQVQVIRAAAHTAHRLWEVCWLLTGTRCFALYSTLNSAVGWVKSALLHCVGASWRGSC